MDKLEFFKNYVLSKPKMVESYAQGSFENGKPVLVFFDGRKETNIENDGKYIEEGIVYCVSYACKDRTRVYPKKYDYRNHVYQLKYSEIQEMLTKGIPNLLQNHYDVMISIMEETDYMLVLHDLLLELSNKYNYDNMLRPAIIWNVLYRRMVEKCGYPLIKKLNDVEQIWHKSFNKIQHVGVDFIFHYALHIKIYYLNEPNFNISSENWENDIISVNNQLMKILEKYGK